MRFATYEHGGTVQAGVVSGDGVHAFPAGVTVLDLVRDGLPAALDAGASVLCGPSVPLDAVRLLPPLEPPSVRDFVAFEEHVEGMVAPGSVPPEWYEAPTFYFTNPCALIGAHDDVPIPPGSRLFDFELEVAAVLGPDAIFGYTILNDWSARDLQGREMRVKLGPAKGKDTATTLGPWLVTADELEGHRDADFLLDLALTVAVNGETVGRDRLANMAWTFEEMAAYASRGTWIRPGDVLGSGTCGNGGCLAELWGRDGVLEPPPLVPGDSVTMTVEGIGSISNTVVEGVAPVPLPPARRRR
jgi:2-keto-4-pentenoate hydratase/2-oxohepta-3-ene-1,7-dioic acid hydratase in catechol pathway